MKTLVNAPHTIPASSETQTEMAKLTGVARLTAEQLLALATFARVNGRTWKSTLNDAWMTHGYHRLSGTTDYGSLQQIRNIFGPRWLLKFSFANTKTHSIKL